MTLNGQLGQLTRELVADGLATGWQVYARGPAGTLDLAGGVDGLGQPVTSRSQFRVYCAIKPLLAMLCGVLAEQGEISFDDRLGDLLPYPGSFPHLTLQDLLAHRSGLWQPDGVHATTLAPPERLPVALAQRHLRPPLARDETLYSEAAAWIVIGAAIEAVTELPLDEAARRLLLSPLGLVEEFLVSERSEGPRPAINVSLRNGRKWPLLIERDHTLEWRFNPGYGGAASSRGLAAIAQEMHDASLGTSALIGSDVAQEMLHSTERLDRTLSMPISFGLGWMRDLPSMDFGSAVSAKSFGHVGLTGMTAVWVDQPTGSVCCYHLNGLVDGPTMVSYVRPRLVRSVMMGIGATD